MTAEQCVADEKHTAATRCFVCLTVCLCAGLSMCLCLQACSLMSVPTTRSWITRTCHSSTRTSCLQDPTPTENLYVIYSM